MITSAYAAGIFDGEGTLGLQRTTSGLYMLLIIGNTCRELIEVLHRTYGGNFYEGNGQEKKEHWKQFYRWQVNGKSTIPFLESVQPYVLIKRRQVELALEFLHDLSPGAGGKRTLEQKARCEEIYAEFRRLNCRGR